MRIAITGQTYYPGNNGQAIFTIHLAEGLVRSGHEVHMFVPHGKFEAGAEVINGVQVHQVRSINFRWLHPEAFLPFLPGGQIQRVFQDFRPEIIHLQDHYFLSRDVVLVARRMHIPMMGTNHFLPENVLPYLHPLPLPRGLKIWTLWQLMLWTYNHLGMVTTPTQTAAQILRQQNIRPPVVPVSCGVDTLRFQPARDFDRHAAREKFGLAAGQVLLLYVGRLDGEKRIDLLLRAVAWLAQHGRTDIQLAVAGQGAAGAALRGLARELGIQSQVHFLGYVPNEDLCLLYQAGDIFCMPSPEELQSIATLEAMASGRPVLAANARALPELVTHGTNGYLFDPGKTEAVVRGITTLADSPEAWDWMGQASRARAMQHSVEKTIQRYAEIYCETIERYHRLDAAKT